MDAPGKTPVGVRDKRLGREDVDIRGVIGKRADAGAIRADVPLGDLLKMAKAFALAAETSPEGPALAERLLTLSMDGLRTRTGPQP